MRPGTPELPDSTDFVCGTLDEDRPLEVAYLSCMEQRKIAKHGIVAQDIDPSFPTSDPEAEEDDDDDDDEDEEVAEGSDGQAWIPGKIDESDDEDDIQPRRSRHNPARTAKGKSPAPSPKRLRSPPPRRRNKSPAPATSKRSHTARSPPPRKLLEHSPRALSPAPLVPASPPSSRRGSFTKTDFGGIDLPTLAQRPHLTHTKSLPKTPNPFWRNHRRIRLAELRRVQNHLQPETMSGMPGDPHSRGPIDIVQGLERKRQRRKEKFWRTHCKHTNGKDKERVCRPGKGAERMREVGIEMADRCKGYGQRLQLVLSV